MYAYSVSPISRQKAPTVIFCPPGVKARSASLRMSNSCERIPCAASIHGHFSVIIRFICIMRHLWFQFQQELFIFGIIDGSFQVFARECAYSLVRLPESDQQNLFFVPIGAPQDLNAPIP